MEHHRLGGFVLQDGVVFAAFGDNYIIGSGVIECQGPIIIEVEKLIEIVDDDGPMVQTVQYNYNALLRGVGNILRYDSPHPTHNQYHHVHRYRVLDGDTEGRIERTDDEDKRPTLGDVIAELREWYDAEYDAIRRRLAGH